MSDKPLPKWPSTLAATPDTNAPGGATLPPAATPSSADSASWSLQPGARPLPDFELVRRLGKGGFGEVWQARGAGGMEVALKFIALDAGGSELETRALEVMKSIRHPNLVSLFGVWRQENRLILAMELCERSLKDRLQEALDQGLPGIPIKELLNYLRDAAAGLDALHDHDVQHRDVKPLNLLLMHKAIKVADFGLAKVLERTAASHSGAMTLAYAAPEFFKGETSPHSDQYSLAATYFELRCGRLLFTGNMQQIMYCHLSQPPDLSSLPEAERAAIARALAKEPDKRWRSCKAFLNELIKAHSATPSKPVKPQGPDKKPLSPAVQPAAKVPPNVAEILAQPTVLPATQRVSPSGSSRLEKPGITSIGKSVVRISEDDGDCPRYPVSVSWASVFFFFFGGIYVALGFYFCLDRTVVFGLWMGIPFIIVGGLNTALSLHVYSRRAKDVLLIALLGVLVGLVLLSLLGIRVYEMEFHPLYTPVSVYIQIIVVMGFVLVPLVSGIVIFRSRTNYRNWKNWRDNVSRAEG